MMSCRRLSCILGLLFLLPFAGILTVSAQMPGVEWEHLGSPIPPYSPHWARLVASPADPETFFLIAEAGLSRSRDGGRTWEAWPLPFGAEGFGFLAIAPMPDDPDSVILSNGRDVYRGMEAGQRWEKLLEAETVSVLAVNPGFPDRLYAAGGFAPAPELFREGKAICYASQDGGKTWLKSSLPDVMPVAWLAPHPTDPEVVYVVTSSEWHGGISGSLFRSQDGGTTWQKLAPGRRMPLIVHPTQPEQMFAVHATQDRFDQIWFEFSLDGGLAWARGVGMEDHPPKQLAFSADPETLYAVANDGIYYSLDDGFLWRPLSRTFQSDNVGAILTTPDRWSIKGRSVAGLLLLTVAGDLYRMRVAQAVTPRAKQLTSWGAIKRVPQGDP